MGLVTGDPIGIYRHHKTCQLGHLDQNNCPHKPLKEKHWGIRICAHHKELVEKIAADAEKAKQGRRGRRAA